MAIGDNYITLAEAKAYCRIDDNVDDSELSTVIDAVCRKIDGYCGQEFNDAGSATARVFHASWSSRSLWLNESPFHTTTGLVVAVDSSDDGTYDTTISSSDYTLFPLNGISDGVTGVPYNRIVFDSDVSLYASNVKPSVQVTARWGWSSVPSAVKQATKIELASVFGRRHSPHGQPVAGQGDFLFRVSTKDLDPSTVALLRPPYSVMRYGVA